MSKSAASSVPPAQIDIGRQGYMQQAQLAAKQLGGLSRGNTATSTVLPQAQQYYSGVAASPGFDANAVNQAGQGMIGQGGQLSAAAFAQGMDPENALYQRNFQQNLDATRASLAARGIAMSPYGAGVENQSNENFNLDWNDRQLGRMQTAAGIMGQASQIQGAGAQLLESVPAQWRSQIATALQGLQTAANSKDASQMQALSEMLQYIGMGEQQQQWANQDVLAANSQLLQQAGMKDQMGAGSAAGWGKLAGEGLGFLASL